MRQQHFLWAWWTRCIKLCTSTQNVSGKITSLNCCFQHVTRAFVGSFPLSHQTCVTCLPFKGLSCLVFTLSSLHCWLAYSCLQLTSDTHVQHPLVKFSDKHLSLSSHATGQVWEVPAVNSLKAILSFQISVCDGESSQLMYCKHCLSWQSSLFSYIPLEENSICVVFISVRPFVLSTYCCCASYSGKGWSLPRPGHAIVKQLSNSMVASGSSVSVWRSAKLNTPTRQVLCWQICLLPHCPLPHATPKFPCETVWLPMLPAGLWEFKRLKYISLTG